MTFERGDDAQQLAIHSKILEFTEDAGQKFGLDQFNVDKGKHSNAHVLNPEQSEAILNLAKDSKDIKVVSSPTITTRSGGQAQVSMQEMHSTSTGEEFATGPAIDLIPTISPDGNSVNLITTAQLNYLVPNPLIK
jgi:type II secretory pathway component GspD/PulD (secretin)